MRRQTIPILRSPVTGNELDVEEYVVEGDDIIEGRLIDRSSPMWFRVEDGIADLAPPHLRREERHRAFCERRGLDIGGPGTAEKPMDKGYADQIRFFKDYSDKYEEEVVRSPFYLLLDDVTLGEWMRKTLRPGQRVVEIACGSGRQTVPLTGHGCDVLGLDLSEEMLILARRKVLASGGAVDFVVGSADALPLASEAFDSAVIYGSLHHFPDAPKACSEAGRVMRKGASFYMLEPHDSALRPIFDWTMRAWTLWEEEASDEPLFTRGQFTEWLRAGNIAARVRYSTYLPPHVFYFMGHGLGKAALKYSDAVLNAVPGIRELAGVIIAEGRKE